MPVPTTLASTRDRAENGAQFMANDVLRDLLGERGAFSIDFGILWDAIFTVYGRLLQICAFGRGNELFSDHYTHTDSIGENVTVKNYDASGLVSAAKNDSCCISLVWVVLRGMFHTVECLICEVIANENNDSQE